MISLSPEILVEQVMGYAIWACELIPTLQANMYPYHIALLPQWPHFYTGLLHAAGYLLLENTKKDILIVSQQSQYPKELIIATNTYGPISGKKWSNSRENISTIAKELNAKKEIIAEDISFHLACINIITKTKRIIHISVWTTISDTKINRLAKRIQEHQEKYNTVILTNIPVASKQNSSPKNEHHEIFKSLQIAHPSFPCLSVFQKIIKNQDIQPQIIAYVNPQRTPQGQSTELRYGCIMQ